MGAYGYGPGCCEALVCGWTPKLTNTILRPLSGSLTLTLNDLGANGRSGDIIATGTGVTVAEGDVGTKGLGSSVRLYGELYPRVAACCATTFTVAFPVITINGATAPVPFGIYEANRGDRSMTYYGTQGPFPWGFPYYDCVWVETGNPHDSMFVYLKRETGEMRVFVTIPYASGGMVGVSSYTSYTGVLGCNGGTLTRDVANTSYTGFYGTQNYPDTIEVVSTANDPQQVWVGIKNSVGIAYTPSSLTWSAVTLGADGNIDTTIAEVETTIATHTPGGAFWWSDEETVQFGWHDEIRDWGGAYSGGVREIKDMIKVDYAKAAPLPRVRTGFVGASGAFATFQAGMRCYGDSCNPNNGMSPSWLQRPPSRFYMLTITSSGGTAGCSTALPYQFYIFAQPYSSEACHWLNVLYSPVYQVWQADIGETDSDKFTLELKGGSSRGKWQIDLTTSFDFWRPFTVTKVAGSDTGSQCLYPETIELSPL